MAVKVKQVDGLQAALDAKANTVDVPQVGSENIVLTAAQTSLSPTGKPTINLFRAPAALPGDVVLHNTFSTGLDAEFAAGVATATIEAGTPTWNPAGFLDQNTGVANTVSAISYERPSHFNPGAGTIRVLWTPNFSGPSPSTIGNTIVAVSSNSVSGWARNNVQIYYDSGGVFRVRSYNTSSQLIHQYNHTLSVVAGQTYELEYSWKGGPDESGFWIDGILVGSDLAWSGGFNVAAGAKILFGGGNNIPTTNGQMSRFHTDHAIEGFTIFNTAQHTVAGGNYTPIGLPGAGVSVENIDEITTTNYADGDELVITTPEFAGYTFVDTASPTTNQLSLDSTFTPSSALDWLKVRRYADYWIEVAREPEPAPAAADSNEVGTTYTCTATEAVGDLVYISGADTVAQADASALGTARAFGHITEKPTSTTCKVSIGPGPLTAAGLTVGAPVYLSDTAGAVSATEGTVIVEVGIADTTTSFVFTGARVIG